MNNHLSKLNVILNQEEYRDLPPMAHEYGGEFRAFHAICALWLLMYFKTDSFDIIL